MLLEPQKTGVLVCCDSKHTHTNASTSSPLNSKPGTSSKKRKKRTERGSSASVMRV